MVYVVANSGQPLIPTERHGKVCRMLRSGMAKVIKKCPFTIQLQYEKDLIVNDRTQMVKNLMKTTQWSPKETMNALTKNLFIKSVRLSREVR